MKIQKMSLNKHSEIRKLPPAVVFTLGQMLESGNIWKQFMAIIPDDPHDINSQPKYTVEHIRLIESAAEKQHRSCAEILFEEWGTSGKIRPSLATLLSVLVKAELYRAAEYIAVDLLKDEPPCRPETGPAARVDVTLTEDSGSSSTRQPVVDPDPLRDSNGDVFLSETCSIFKLPFSQVQQITDNFDETPLVRTYNSDGYIIYTGRKLGTGAFGSVYYGKLENGVQVAVKRLNKEPDNITQQFKNEISALSKYCHVNLLPLLGYTCENDEYCLIYKFMENGSLLDKLAVKETVSDLVSNTDNNVMKDVPLTWSQRIDIAIGTCRGIEFLHCSQPVPLIHRDIKTANILLDEHLVPKLGDFGLVKAYHTSSSKMMTSTIFGTTAYMAPESFRGDISVKMDVFSMGVVFLELLTGLPPYDDSRETGDLISFIDNKVDDCIEPFLDKSAGEWDLIIAEALFELSKSCLKDKKLRPSITKVCEDLESMSCVC